MSKIIKFRPKADAEPKRERRTAQKHPWYSHYPQDFYDGTRGLFLEEIGAYQLLIGWMYQLNGPVPDVESDIVSYLRLKNPRPWRRIRKVLLDKQKLFITKGGLYNHRVHEEVVSRNFGRTLPEHSANVQPNLFDNPLESHKPALQSQSQSQIQKEDPPPPSRTRTREAPEEELPTGPLVTIGPDGRLELHGTERKYWLERFEDNAQALEDALMRAAEYVQPNGGKPLEVKLRAQMAKVVGWWKQDEERKKLAPSAQPRRSGGKQSKADKIRAFMES